MKFNINDFTNCPTIRFSSIRDIQKDKPLVYKTIAPYTDKYIVTTNNVESYKLYDSKGNEAGASLNKDEVYYLYISAKENANIEFNVQAEDNKAVLPYDSPFKNKATDFKVDDNNTTDPLKPAKLEYIKRGTGTYVNCNNPETLHQHHLNQALCRDTLEGNVFFTFEHNNLLLDKTYYGYMVKNTNKHDVFITIKNIGLHEQGQGSWLGQNEWIQFYNTKFQHSTEGFNEEEMQIFLNEYNFSDDYVPLFNQPTTYRLPANEEIFVIGGTSDITYNNYDAFNTANRLVSKTCSNGAVYFEVVGGQVEGSFYVYDDSKNLNKDNVLGYVSGEYNHPFGHPENFGVQYGGSDNCDGVVENEMFWEFNDVTPSQLLPVTYINHYSKDAPENGEPFGLIPGIKEYTQNRTDWVTHINPQSNEAAVVTDMTWYKTIDKNKNPICIKPGYYDGIGNFANIGNWMMNYQDRFTLVNKGDKPREVTLNYTDKGSTAIMIRDVDGNVVDAIYTMSKIKDNTYRYTVTVQPHSVYQFTFEYNLLGNSYGNVIHSVNLK